MEYPGAHSLPTFPMNKPVEPPPIEAAVAVLLSLAPFNTDRTGNWRRARPRAALRARLRDVGLGVLAFSTSLGLALLAVSLRLVDF